MTDTSRTAAQSVFRDAIPPAAHAAHGDRQPQNFEEVRTWTAEHKPHDLQHLNVFLETWGYGPAYLLALSSAAPDPHSPAPHAFSSLLDWFDAAFPKSRRNQHPRLDLGVSLARYKKVREGVRRAIRGSMGAYERRAARNAAEDGWAELLALLKPLTENAGPLDARSFSMLKSFADIARRADLQPWQLAADTYEELEKAFATVPARELSKRAIATLNAWNGLVAFEDLLPPAPLPPLPVRRRAGELPPQIAARIDELVAIAATRIDLNTNKAHDRVSSEARDLYRAALRYHIKLLPQCPENPDMAYDRPVTDLESVNDVDALFAPEHISATIRATEDREHLPEALQADTALAYYKTVRLVLEKSLAAFDSGWSTEIKKRIKSSDYFKGVDRDEMPEHLQDWCRDLVNDPVKERRFHNLHRIFRAKAEAIMQTAQDETGRFHPERLSADDRARVIRLGVCAAVCAVMLTGRPLRLRNAIWLRHRGRRANINPRAGWEFFIPAEEAKAGKKIPEMTPCAERHGPAVLDWYLAHIRPLIDPKNASIYLFPSIRTPGGRLNPSTFRYWFQSAANDAGMAMTFNRFRHGFASILIREGEDIRNISDMLANTPAVCARRYAFLDPDRGATHSQNTMTRAANNVEQTLRRGART